jgi:transcription initiation factor TFIIIB Brf1 subunit/transcription initiation factor TFIIB
MPYPEYLCGHENVIDDTREGCSVCTDCGLVLEDKIFLPSYDETYFHPPFQTFENNQTKQEITELLHRINLPNTYSTQISKNCLKKKYKTKSIPFVLYQTLNENGCPISLKEISAVSGLTNSEIYKHQDNNDAIILRPEEMLEKYCTILKLNFKEYSVIKENIKGSLKTGHNNLTIIGANIYLYGKQNNLKLSIKLIAKTLNISCISIQRYIKKQKE